MCTARQISGPIFPRNLRLPLTGGALWPMLCPPPSSSEIIVACLILCRPLHVSPHHLENILQFLRVFRWCLRALAGPGRLFVNNALGRLGSLPCVMNAGEYPVIRHTCVNRQLQLRPLLVPCPLIGTCELSDHCFDGPVGPFRRVLLRSIWSRELVSHPQLIQKPPERPTCELHEHFRVSTAARGHEICAHGCPCFYRLLC